MTRSAPGDDSGDDGADTAGRGRPTMADVARAAGTSTALVSIVMRGVAGASDDTRRRVAAVAAELGYVPDERARRLRQQSSRLIGVTFGLQQPFHGDVVEHLYVAAARRGYDVALSAVAPTRDESTAVDALLRERCEAAVLLGSTRPDDELARLAARVPTVLVMRRSEAAGASTVRGDDEAGVALAVDHLVALGHRRIVHVAGGGAPGSEDRRRAFLAATAAAGATAEVRPGGLAEDDGARAMTELLAGPARPTAVLAFNDRVATGVLDVLVRRGVDVPGDISVAGYDDSRIARVPRARLTTVAQDAERLAGAAVDAALALVGGAAPSRTVIAPRLVVRATTGPPTE